ncbi:MAG: hypothetical protein JOY66_24580 [Acetobacteraceae bacterium]|nr:hypothetical protein [Acetobacteraceae bacterium]
MTSLSTALSGMVDAVSSQVSHGRAAEVTVDPSSEHGHQGDGDVFILNRDDMKFELFRSSRDISYIYGRNDLAAYYGGGEQTIYDFGAGTHLQFSESTAPIRVYGLQNDSSAVVDMFNAPSGTTLRPDGHGGTMVGNIDFVGATVRASQVSFLTTDHPLSSGGFV